VRGLRCLEPRGKGDKALSTCEARGRVAVAVGLQVRARVKARVRARLRLRRRRRRRRRRRLRRRLRLRVVAVGLQVRAAQPDVWREQPRAHAIVTLEGGLMHRRVAVVIEQCLVRVRVRVGG